MRLVSKAISFGLSAAACAVLLSACASYHQVRDLSSGKEYYTEDLTRSGTGVRFTDARTGSQISLQNSEVSEIPEEIYSQVVSAPMLVIIPTVVPAAPASAGR